MKTRIDYACVKEAREGRREILRAMEIIREGGTHEWVNSQHMSRDMALISMSEELEDLNTWLGDDDAIDAMTSKKFRENTTYDEAVSLIRKMKREVKTFEEGIPQGAILNWVDCEFVKDCIPVLEKKLKAVGRKMNYISRTSVRQRRPPNKHVCRWCSNSEFEKLGKELRCLCCGSFKQL